MLLATLATLAALVASCASVVPGEVTEAACSTPRIDEDHDGLFDCEDPDCHGFEVCRERRNREPSTGGNDGSGGSGGSGGVGGLGGAAPPTGGSGGSDDDDAGGDDPRDAGDAASAMDAEPPEPCGGSCGVGAVCNLDTNKCEATGSEGGLYAITVLSATVPRETPPVLCVDACQGPTVWCPCPPDPFVKVIHVRPASDPDDPPVEEELLQTATLRDNEMPMFSEAPTQLELLPGDVLRFELWQDPLFDANKLVFECTPDLSEVEPGELSCTAMSGPAGDQPFTIRARLDSVPQ